VTLGLCSQIDLDFEVARAAKDRPPVVEEAGQTLLPAEVTTAREPAAQPFANLTAPKPKEEEAPDVASVFAKLKQLKTSE
jgi:uncharacterized protein